MLGAQRERSDDLQALATVVSEPQVRAVHPPAELDSSGVADFNSHTDALTIADVVHCDELADYKIWHEREMAGLRADLAELRKDAQNWTHEAVNTVRLVQAVPALDQAARDRHLLSQAMDIALCRVLDEVAPAEEFPNVVCFEQVKDTETCVARWCEITRGRAQYSLEMLDGVNYAVPGCETIDVDHHRHHHHHAICFKDRTAIMRAVNTLTRCVGPATLLVDLLFDNNWLP